MFCNNMFRFVIKHTIYDSRFYYFIDSSLWYQSCCPY